MAEGGPAEGCASVPAGGAEYAEGCCYEEKEDKGGGTAHPRVAHNTQKKNGTPSPHSAPSATLCASVPAAVSVLARPRDALCAPSAALCAGVCGGAAGSARLAGMRRYGANKSTAPRTRPRRDDETQAPGRSQRAPGRRTT